MPRRPYILSLLLHAAGAIVAWALGGSPQAPGARVPRLVLRAARPAAVEQPENAEREELVIEAAWSPPAFEELRPEVEFDPAVTEEALAELEVQVQEAPAVEQALAVSGPTIDTLRKRTRPRALPPASPPAPASTAQPRPAVQPPPAVQPRPAVQERDVGPTPWATNARPTYPLAALRAGVEGTVLLRLLVGMDGRVRLASVGTSSGHAALDGEALRVARDWRFEPALRAGQPAEYVLLQRVHFRRPGP